MKKILLIILFVLMPSLAAYAQQTLTLSTYHPAPFGAYDRLRLDPRPPIAAGDCRLDLAGTLYVEQGAGPGLPNKLQYCQDDGNGNFFWGPLAGVWTQKNIDANTAQVYLSDPNRAINVGIGVQNPNVKFEIKGFNDGGIDKTMALYPDGPGSTAGILFAPSKFDLDNINIGKNVGYIGIGTLPSHFGTNVQPGDISLGTPVGKDLHLTTRDSSDPNLTTTKLIVKNNGNVGIGTTIPPQNRLDVMGGGIDIDSDGDLNWGSIYNSVTGEGLVLSGKRQSVAREDIVVTEDGNVGIGTANPQTRLSMPNGEIGIGSQNSATNFLRIGMDANWGQYLANNAYWTGTQYHYVNPLGYGGRANRIHQTMGTIQFDTASGGTNPISWSNRLYIANNGNVGIGTTNPLGKFHVAGYFLIAEDTGAPQTNDFSGLNAQNTLIHLYGPNGRTGSGVPVSKFIAFQADTHQFRNYNNTRTYMRITPSGNIGIGTQTPRAKLDVAGSVKLANSTPFPADCDNTKGGTQRYNSATGAMEYCNGITWTWTSLVGGVGGGGDDPGSLCGVYFVACGGVPPQDHPCDGVYVSAGCPAGYTRQQVAQSTWYKACEAYLYSCVKN